MRIHITGGPGAGKTTLARTLARHLNLELLDLDGTGLDIESGIVPMDFDALAAARREHSLAFASADSWISEGSNILVAEPLLQRAEVIVVLYTPWRVASYRILIRHLKAELARNNRFPGYRRLYEFWRWSARFYANTNPPGLNGWGTPTTQATLEEFLGPYEDKLMRCSSKAEMKGVLADLVRR